VSIFGEAAPAEIGIPRDRDTCANCGKEIGKTTSERYDWWNEFPWWHTETGKEVCA
jgi:hypothetical protein